MSKKLKYKWLMDEKEISIPCPSKNCQETELEAYRWGHDPKENDLNFLPNFLYNEKKSGTPMRFNSENDLKNCGNCSLSLFDSKEAAIDFWFSEKKYMEKIRELLQYTHILKGEIKKEFGVTTKERPHLELFEYEGVELRNHFEILEPLIKP